MGERHYPPSVKLRTAEEMLGALASVDHQSIEWEIKKLRAIRSWALRQAWAWGDITEGDRVTLHGVPIVGRWNGYSECLADGALATVTEVDFNSHSDDGRGMWHASVRLDREWSNPTGHVADSGKRYWHGAAADTPEGMVPPHAYDQENYPDGRRHAFSIPVRYLRPAALVEGSDG